MAVREHTDVYYKNYYWSSFNPYKTFQTLESAENYEKLYYVEHFKNIKFYRDKDFTQEIDFSYDPQLEYEYYAGLGKLEERYTVEPTFTGAVIEDEGRVQEELSLYYFFDEAKYMKITQYTDETIPQYKKIKTMNTVISKLNRYWKMDLPLSPGKYEYSKINGWTKLSS